MPPQRKPVQRKALPAVALPSRASKRNLPPTTIADLSADVLLRTLALTGYDAVHAAPLPESCICPLMISASLRALHRHPARYASVCSRWNDLLADSSEVWKECVLTSTRKPPPQQVEGPEETGAMLAWLVRRCTGIESITFRKFKVGTWVHWLVHC